ncbi:hypothetical protein EJB05_57138, partial [Eragrostis curvula]
MVVRWSPHVTDEREQVPSSVSPTMYISCGRYNSTGGCVMLQNSIDPVSSLPGPNKSGHPYQI